MEVWKAVKDYEGLYEVSNLGRVRSVERFIAYTHTNPNMKGHTVKSKIKTPINNGNGYLAVELYKNNKSKRLYIHRLVAEAFIPNPENKLTVNHKDFNRGNNTAENLEWATQREQLTHKYASKGYKGNTKTIRVIYENGTYVDYPSVSEASRQLNCHRDTIYNMIKGVSQFMRDNKIKLVQYI